MNALDIVEAAAVLLEPDETQRAPVSDMAPSEYDPELLYMWLDSATSGIVATGPTYELNFYIYAVWIASPSDEADTARILQTKAAAYLMSLLSHPVYTPYWEDIFVDQFTSGETNTHDGRGLQMRLRGYVLADYLR